MPIINLKTRAGRLLDRYYDELRFHETKVKYYKEAIEKLKILQYEEEEASSD